MIYLAATIIVFVIFIYKYLIHCRMFGHKFKSEVLWRSCKCCNKTQVLKIGTGFVD